MLAAKIVTSLLPAKIDNVFVAYSGGIDSHVLLHLTSSIAEIKSKITAVYIHHGLQIEADHWATHCESVSLSLGVKFQCMTVNAQKSVGLSPEEVARNARYDALQTIIGKHDVLLVAHHREDQMETVLLQLFRGAGIQGLSGMPLTCDFGAGKKCRPFLNIAKQTIKDYAEVNKLSWVKDPSNQCNDFDRNFLRNEVLPRLSQRWPGLDKTVSRSARHCAMSHLLIDDLGKQIMYPLFDETDQTLNIPRLLQLEIEKQHLVIRQWFKFCQLRMPTEKNLQVIINEVVLAKAGANPEIRIQGHSIRRYQKKLYCLKQDYDYPVRKEKTWPERLTEFKLNEQLTLSLLAASEGISKKLWNSSDVTVKFRTGAEKIKLPGRVGHHSLKKLFQSKSIPPWERSKLPLIYINGSLAAIADLWISADFYSSDEDGCYQFRLLSAI